MWWQDTYKERHNRIWDVSHRRTMTTTITMTMPMTSRTTKTITTAAATAPALDSSSVDGSAEDVAGIVAGIVAGSVAVTTGGDTCTSVLDQLLIPYTRILPQKPKHAHKQTGVSVCHIKKHTVWAYLLLECFAVCPLLCRHPQRCCIQLLGQGHQSPPLNQSCWQCW